MRKTVIVGKEKYFYRGKVYDISSIRKVIGNDIKFILIDENISVKVFDGVEKVKDGFVKSIIDVEYSEDFNILTHYEYNKKESKLYLYSIGNGSRIKGLTSGVKKLEVLPIQFYISKAVGKRFKKEKKYSVISCINNMIYYLDIENSFIVNSYVEKYNGLGANIDIAKKIKNKTIIIDNIIDNEISIDDKRELNTYVMKIGENINEKIHKI